MKNVLLRDILSKYPDDIEVWISVLRWGDLEYEGVHTVEEESPYGREQVLVLRTKGLYDDSES
jgi:hypothetical protein